MKLFKKMEVDQTFDTKPLYIFIQFYQRRLRKGRSKLLDRRERRARLESLGI